MVTRKDSEANESGPGGDDWADELNDHMDSGGCAEAWEALNELRGVDVNLSEVDDCDGDLEAVDFVELSDDLDVEEAFADLDVEEIPDELDEEHLPEELTEQLTDDQLDQLETLATSKNFFRAIKLAASGELDAMAAAHRGPTASRRGVLKSAGAAAGAAFGLMPAMSTLAAAASQDHIDARKLDGSERDAVIDEMEARNDYWDIESAMYDDGWDQVDRSEWVAIEVTDYERDVVYQTANVPMEPADGSEMPPDEATTIEYTNDPSADDPVKGSHTERDPDDRKFVPDDAVVLTDTYDGYDAPNGNSVASWDAGSACRVLGGGIVDAYGSTWYLLESLSNDPSQLWFAEYTFERTAFFNGQRVHTAVIK